MNRSAGDASRLPVGHILLRLILHRLFFPGIALAGF
jgi:hypothetical protein